MYGCMPREDGEQRNLTWAGETELERLGKSEKDVCGKLKLPRILICFIHQFTKNTHYVSKQWKLPPLGYIEHPNTEMVKQLGTIQNKSNNNFKKYQTTDRIGKSHVCQMTDRIGESHDCQMTDRIGERVMLAIRQTGLEKVMIAKQQTGSERVIIANESNDCQ